MKNIAHSSQPHFKWPILTYSDKKVDHKKYIKGEVDLLRHVARPLLALFDTLADEDGHQKETREKNIIDYNQSTSAGTGLNKEKNMGPFIL